MENPEDVWDSDYLAVHHFNEVAGQHQDSTSYNNDSTELSVTTQGSSEGVVGNCDVLDGTNDFIQFNHRSGGGYHNCLRGFCRVDYLLGKSH